MATMATITTPAIPIVSNGSLRTRGNCKQSSRGLCQRGQSEERGVRFVVRASDDVASSGSVVGQTPTSPIETLKPSPLQKGGTDEGSGVGQTPTSPIETLKPSPLQKGGTDEGSGVGQTPTSPIETLKPSPGDEAAGKDPAPSKASAVADAGKFDDPRWRAGTWDITKFTSNGKINWDAVIDAEVSRRKWLEENPEASSDSEPVVFDTATVPWWAWVKRFHLPEAELLNGRAAMVGYAVGYLVDSATGVGLVDQQNTFLGKALLFLTVLGVLLIRKNSDVQNLRTIAKESTFYDKQWQQTWKDDDDKESLKDPSDIS